MTTLELYRTMRTSELKLLREAFLLDFIESEMTTAGAVFVFERLAWILAVLEERASAAGDPGHE